MRTTVAATEEATTTHRSMGRQEKMKQAFLSPNTSKSNSRCHSKRAFSLALISKPQRGVLKNPPAGLAYFGSPTKERLLAPASPRPGQDQSFRAFSKQKVILQCPPQGCDTSDIQKLEAGNALPSLLTKKFPVQACCFQVSSI